MFENKKVFVLGFARSGYAAAKVLVTNGAKVVLNDKNVDQDQVLKAELEALGVEIILGSHPEDLFDDSFDLLVKNPGVPNEHMYIEKANELNIDVVTELEVAYKFLKDNEMIAITGTNGKTTTTTLIYNFIKTDGKKVHLTGNIGHALCNFVGKVEPEDIIVLEYSVQQLATVKDLNPNVGIFTNISPAHIDFFKSYDNYKNIKKRIFKNQSSDDVAIINADDDELLELLYDIKSDKKYFSSSREKGDCYLKDGVIYYRDEEVVKTKDIMLVGRHNYENIMAAIIAVKKYDVSNEAIRTVLSEFTGVAHRLERVREINGTVYYNDSKATNIVSTHIALNSFKQPTILMLGGMERGQEFAELTPDLNYVKTVIAFGETNDRIKEMMDSLMIECFVEPGLEAATNRALKIAKENDVVLLSPASASWDEFGNFEQRGNLYKQIINEYQD